MGFFERVVRALIYVAFIALAYYLILWVLSAIGVAIPAMVAKILGVILVLVAILVLVRLFAGSAWPAGWRWFPDDRRGPPPV